VVWQDNFSRNESGFGTPIPRTGAERRLHLRVASREHLGYRIRGSRSHAVSTATKLRALQDKRGQNVLLGLSATAVCSTQLRRPAAASATPAHPALQKQPQGVRFGMKVMVTWTLTGTNEGCVFRRRAISRSRATETLQTRVITFEDARPAQCQPV